MEFFTAVRQRRSIRRYRPDPVPREKLSPILEAVRLAPSACNLLHRKLNLSPEWEAVAVTPLGYPAGAPQPFSRKSLQDITEFI